MTKPSKSFPTYFVPIGGNALAIVEDWVSYLQRDRLWGPDDPLFPATLVVDLDANGQFAAVRYRSQRMAKCGGSPENIPRCLRLGRPSLQQSAYVSENASPVRPANLPDPEEYKAFSQNIGHEDVLTTFTSYGEVPLERQAAIIRSLRSREEAVDNAELANEIMDLLSRRKSG